MLKTLKEAELDKEPLSKAAVYDIIRAYLQEQTDLITRGMLKDVSFESPAWSEKQAYSLGELKMLNKILEFIPTLTKGN